MMYTRTYQGLKLRKYFRGQEGPYQITFGSPHNLLGAHQARIARLPPRLRGALRQGLGAAQSPGSPGINGVNSCILAISWQQNWPFRNYNLIQKIQNFQNIFLKINLFYMHQYTMTSKIYSCTSCSKWIFIFCSLQYEQTMLVSVSTNLLLLPLNGHHQQVDCSAMWSTHVVQKLFKSWQSCQQNIQLKILVYTVGQFCFHSFKNCLD